jgi:DNA-binding NtrC family response regulator
MKKQHRILIVDDEPAARYALRRALESAYDVVEADSAAAARGQIAKDRPDLIVLDMVMPEESGIEFLRWLREQGHQQPVLVASVLDSAQTAVEALHHGAGDYVVKGYEVEELRNRVKNLLKLADLDSENARLRRELVAEGQFGRMLGRSAAMQRVFEMVERAAPTDATILVLGESGTGKDLLAQEIHARSPRAGPR